MPKTRGVAGGLSKRSLFIRIFGTVLVLFGLVQFGAYEYHQGIEEGILQAGVHHLEGSPSIQQGEELSGSGGINQTALVRASSPALGPGAPGSSATRNETKAPNTESGGVTTLQPALSTPSPATAKADKLERGSPKKQEIPPAKVQTSQGPSASPSGLPPCSLVHLENGTMSECHTRKGRTVAELEELKRLFSVRKCKYDITRGIIKAVPLEKLEAIAAAKKTVITYGTPEWARSKKRACQQATGAGAADNCMAMDQQIMDGRFRKKNKEILSRRRGGGLWLWKPYIINKTLASMNEGDYLLYHDAGAFISGPIHPLLALMESGFHSPPLNGILTFGVGLPQSKFCKRDTFILQKCDTPQCHDAMQVDGFLSVWKKGPHAQKVVEMWLSDCQDMDKIGDGGNKLGQKNLDGFKDHRHDQAILTNILSREGFGRDTSNGPATFMITHDRKSNGALPDLPIVLSPPQSQTRKM